MFTLINTILLIVLIVLVSRKKVHVEISDCRRFDGDKNRNGRRN